MDSNPQCERPKYGRPDYGQEDPVLSSGVWVVLFIVVCLFAAAFLGYAIGNNTPSDKVLVPKTEGKPSDLPTWACEEIVRARWDSYDAYAQLGTWHYDRHLKRFRHLNKPYWGDYGYPQLPDSWECPNDD